jgi:hypothetical protein
VSLGSAFQSPESKRAHVRRLFATIADRYDFITRAWFAKRGWRRRMWCSTWHAAPGILRCWREPPALAA